MILYTNKLKNREFDKEASHIFCSEQVTIAERQGTNENNKCETRPTPSKTDSSGCLCITAKNIKKTYYSPCAVPVLNGLDIDVAQGQAIAIMGKSGEGKSTLLHILGTLEKPCSGEITICGQPIDKISLNKIRNKHIGFVFQSCHLLDDYTLLDNILMPAKIARQHTGKLSPAYKRALDLLEKVGLSQRAFFPSKLLSGGEKQRAAIARALCNDPELILADEPSGNLDHAHSQAIHSLLIHLTKERGKSLIVVTHDKELAALCDHIYILKDGILSSDA